MIDFHAHILPKVDDGSKSEAMSKEMIINSLSQNVDGICATPHFVIGEHEIDREQYCAEKEELKKSVNLEIDILDGLEILIDPELPRLFKEKKIWGLNNKRYLLIELPMNQYPIYTESVLYQLRLLGAVPVLAHPERNSIIANNIELLIKLIQQGNLAQINAGSLMGLFGIKVKKTAEKLIKMNLVHIIGSDAHNNSKRNTDLAKGYKKINQLNSCLYKWMADNEINILNGLEMAIPDILSKRKSFFDFFNFDNL